MRRLTRWVLGHPRLALGCWAVVFVLAAPLALRLPEVAAGATETIAGSESDRAERALQRAFGPGAPFAVPVVVHGESHAAERDLRSAVEAVTAALRLLPEVRAARSFWDGGDRLLLGRDARSALLLVETSAASIVQAENLTPVIRRGVARADLPAGYRASVTGTPAMFHDLNRNASDDLGRAELVGIPLVLLILLAVFRSPLAAALPLALAGGAALLAFAGLYLLREVFPASVFTQNAVTMIGLGAGVDYALFVVHRFRAELARGAPVSEAVIESAAAIGPALAVSGAAVGIGFLALFLVNASFLQSVAVGGLLVIAGAVALSLCALPLALAMLGSHINWPFGAATARRLDSGHSGLWRAWTARVMARPWAYLVPALAALALIAAPAMRVSPWNVGAKHLPAHMESRLGEEALARNFSAGWMGPVALAVEAAPGHSLLDAREQVALRAIAARLERDERVAAVAALQATPRVAVLLLLPRNAPEHRDTTALVRALRADPWSEARGTGIAFAVGGASAAMLDFDAEMLGAMWRVVPAVLAVTFVVLVAFFRSLLVPLKAVCANLVSVLAAFGFLVLVFQDGVGAAAFGIEPPGGINSFIVVMLFTILFGLSMDYEVFLLRSIQEERGTRGSDAAVGAGLARSAGLITSAAAIMVCLFASFALTELTATREFGLGLAVAVALDASLIRLLVIPALMKLAGEANWWFPGASA